ncbi:hypothetical protein MG290_14710 (plasmid) [Flavobacterium sp. CBA20B-1]|uniref:hypothetical protein n=1 Tax=unclassified Flavobacterium TaxID=196869 RepID=UPI0022247F6E|nr:MULTISPECIES: hypothetical protein [unclassified Flavobacterium]WCM43613.1 hypothetical protein MG290_14710 [Flavobacterium sp. CBA20B-1]
MASGEGVITRKDIITDDALAFGTLLAEQAEISIKKVEELKRVFKELKNIPKDVKNASDYKDLSVTLEKNIKLSNKYIQVLKEQIKLEQTMDRMKKSSIANEKSETKAKIDNANATRAAEKATNTYVQKVLNTSSSIAKQKDKETENDTKNTRKKIQNSLDFSQAMEKQKQQIIEAAKKESEAAQKSADVVAKSNEKKRISDIQLQKAREKAFDDYEKKLQKEAVAQEKLSNVYNKVQLKINGMTATYNNIAAKKELGLKLTTQEESQLASLEKRLLKYNDVLKRVDAQIGKHQRNVGNYKSGWDGLGNSINQITREMPAFAVSAQTGFLALSNNIPMLADEIQRVSKNVKELRAQGQQVPGVMSQILSSFLSWQTALSVGVTLVTLYGKEIGEFFKEVFRGNKVIASSAKLLETYNKTLKDGDYEKAYTDVAKVAISFEQARKGVISKKDALKVYNSVLGDVMGKTNDFAKAENTLNNQARNYVEATMAKAQANILLSESAQLAAENVELQGKKEVTWGEQLKAYLQSGGPFSKFVDPFNEKISENRTKKIKENTEQINANRKAAEELVKKFQELSKSLNMGNLFGDDLDEKKGKTPEQLEKERLEALKKAFEDEIDLRIQAANQQADINKRISQDEKSLFENRLSALSAYEEESENALRLEAEKKIKSLSNFSKEYKALTDDEIQTYLKQEGDLSKLKDDQILIFKEYYFELKKLREENKENLQKNAEIEAKIIAANTAAVISGGDIRRLEELTKIEEEFRKLTFKNNSERIKAVEKREKEILAVNRKYDKITLEEQIKQMIKTLEILGLEGEKIIELKKKLAELQNQSVKTDNENKNTDAEDEIKKEKEKLEKLKKYLTEFSDGFASSTGISSKVVEDFIMTAVDQFSTLEEKIKATFMFMKEFSNSFYQQRIEEIQDEIDLIQEKNDRELESFTGTEKEKERLRIRFRAEEQKLEEKKRKEKVKQANLDKAFSIAQTIWATAQAIMQAYAQLGPIGGKIASIFVGALGAVQIAAISSAKIPKYKMGREGGPEEIAIVGDGGVHEVIEHKDGSAYMTPNTDTLVKLEQGDTVHKSVEDYQKSLQKSMINKMSKDTEKYLDQTRRDSILQDKIEENTREIKALHATMKRKKMATTVNVPKIDFEYAQWLSKNR